MCLMRDWADMMLRPKRRPVSWAVIEGFRVQNFGVLRDVDLGRRLSHQDVAPLTSMTAVIGKNGVGKSTLFDAFGFLGRRPSNSVSRRRATHAGGEGFRRLRSQGRSGPVQYEGRLSGARKRRPDHLHASPSTKMPPGRPSVFERGTRAIARSAKLRSFFPRFSWSSTGKVSSGQTMAASTSRSAMALARNTLG